MSVRTCRGAQVWNVSGDSQTGSPAPERHAAAVCWARPGTAPPACAAASRCSDPAPRESPAPPACAPPQRRATGRLFRARTSPCLVSILLPGARKGSCSAWAVRLWLCGLWHTQAAPRHRPPRSRRRTAEPRGGCETCFPRARRVCKRVVYMKRRRRPLSVVPTLPPSSLPSVPLSNPHTPSAAAFSRLSASRSSSVSMLSAQRRRESSF